MRLISLEPKQTQLLDYWSGREDLNLRPLAPHAKFKTALQDISGLCFRAFSSNNLRNFCAVVTRANAGAIWNIRRNLAAVFVVATLSGCGAGGPPTYPGTPTTAPWLTKTDTTIDTHLEATPVIFNGSLHYVSCDRDTSTHGINVFDQNAKMVAHFQSSMYLCSAIVTSDGVLHVFGASGAQVRMASTSDLITWTEQQVMATGQTTYNTSVAPDKTGFVMAYENCASHCTFQFAHSDDLVNWKPVGKWNDPHYTACPTVRYANGNYYVTFLGSFESGIYSTLIARSKDLITWETSPQAVVSPLDGLDAKIGSGNTSDLDLVEVAGMVLIEYQNFDQHGGGTPGTGTRLAYYQGTMAQFFEEFFK